MGKEHYNAVRESDLYEYGGYRKSLLMQIAGLIIGPREEDAQGKPIGEPDPDEGWCVARQEVLAAWIGCSREQVVRMVAEFEADGWLTVKEFTDTFGHERRHYTITPTQLKKIQAHKMKIEEKNGLKHPVRAKKPSNARGEKSLKNLVKPVSGKRSHHKKLEPPWDGSSQSPVTDSHKAQCQPVTKPCDQSSQSVVSPVFPSLGINNRNSLEAKAKPGDDFSSPKGKKETPKTPYALPGGNQGVSAAARRPAAKPEKEVRPKKVVLLKPEVREYFRSMGAPQRLLDKIEGGYTFIATILNGDTPGGCSNPLTAYASIAENNPVFAKIWMPTLGGKQVVADNAEEAEAMLAMRAKRDSMTADEKDREDSKFWFVSKRSWHEIQKKHGKDSEDPAKTYDIPEAEYESNDLMGDMETKASEKRRLAAILQAYLKEMQTGSTYEAKKWREKRGVSEPEMAAAA